MGRWHCLILSPGKPNQALAAVCLDRGERCPDLKDSCVRRSKPPVSLFHSLCALSPAIAGVSPACRLPLGKIPLYALHMQQAPNTSECALPRLTSLARHGFTLLEVMISVAILAVILAGVMGGFGGLVQGRQTLDGEQRVANLFTSFSERMRDVPWTDLGTNEAPWSRDNPITAADDTFLGDDPGLADDRVLQTIDGRATLGITDQELGLENLRVNLEYFYALSDTDLGVVGYMDDPENADFLIGLPRDLEAGLVVWRVTVRWGDDLERQPNCGERDENDDHPYYACGDHLGRVDDCHGYFGVPVGCSQ